MSPLIEDSRRIARGFYDFAVDGGAISTIQLRGDKIPSGAIIVDVLLHVDTIVTSGGAGTLAIGSGEATNDLNAADAVSGAPWSSVGAKRGDFTAITAPVKTTAERSITATIAAFALTAGKFSVLVSYHELAS